VFELEIRLITRSGWTIRPAKSRPCGRLDPMKSALVAVGMPVTRHPPHSPVLARLAHTVPALDVWRQSVRSDRGVGFRLQVARRQVAPETVSTSSGSAGSVAGASAASLAALRAETLSFSPRCPEQHGIGNTPSPPTAATPASPGLSRACAVAALP
jgi:hypothetical protein